MLARSRLIALVLALTMACFGAQRLRADNQFTPDQIAFFETNIRPVLIEHCYECHSAGAEELQGGLRLDFRDTLMRGGDSGPAIIAGNPGESLLIQSLHHDAFEMPPEEKLPDHVIANFETWVAMGAPDPRVGGDVAFAAPDEFIGRDHWAFQPVVEPPIPNVIDHQWPVNNIDYFILDRLEQSGLTPARDADRYSWLRRVSIDLTGLPPTLEEIEEFVADDSATAYERVVDRLLGSRAFGERWATYWLDLVGYADQEGTQAPIYATDAWRYRDYVIDGFNEDKPFDQFVRQQLAGDLMPADSIDERRENLIATGYLVLGDLPLVEADKEKLRVEVIDVQVDRLGKAFLGLTLGCARCHDHKFDPVPRDDYYAMAGMFYSTSSVFKTTVGTWTLANDIELPETEQETRLRFERENEQARKLAGLVDEERQAELRVAELDELLTEVDEQEKKQREDAKKQAQEAKQSESQDGETAKTESGQEKKSEDEPELSAEEQKIKELKEERSKLKTRLAALDKLIAHAELFVSQIPIAQGVRDRPEPTDMRITIRGNPRALGAAVPRGVLSILPTTSTEIPDGQSGRMQLADWIASPDNPLTTRVAVNRIWQKLIGKGLQRNVDYFGVPEETPSHPELLDYLATSFVDNGWSRKKLIRSIVLSRTYRMSSHHDERASQIDPNNRLIWRMNRGRMDAEALRDALVFASGTMQHFAGGPTLPFEIPSNVVNIGKGRVPINLVFFNLGTFRPDQEHHRTCYLPILRGTPQHRLADLRNVFDFNPPVLTSGQRSVTTVPTQSLFLMNSPLVKKHAKSIAERVETEAEEESRRLELLWLYVLNRPVTASEKTRAVAFLNDSGEEAWPELCHALIASNEFLMRF